MGVKTGLAQIDMRKPDGAFFTRLEMEQQLREKLSTVHHRRLKAINLGLDSRAAYDMYPISVTHWILDQWVLKGEVRGEYIGVRSELKADSDNEYFRQFTQRLAMFIENGWAVLPNPGEGIDMNQMNQPPMPPMPPNGQQGPQQFAPPAPPQMPPGMPGMPPGMPPMPQMGAPQQQFGGPPMPPMPPQAPQAPMPPTPPQPQYGGYPQQQPQQYTQAGPPQPPMPPQQPQYQQPPQVPQQQAATLGVPTKADPNRQWGKPADPARKRRTKEEVTEDTAYEAWTKSGGDPNIGSVPQQAPQQFQPPQQAPQFQPPQAPQAPMPPQAASAGAPTLQPPNPFGVMGPGPNAAPPQPQFGGGFPGVPQAAPAPQAAAPVSNNEAKLLEEIDGLRDDVDTLKNQLAIVNRGLAFIMRGMLQNKGDLDVHLVLAEQGLTPR
jgi:hypothetical protein